jgi:hypothetical protein
MLFTLPTSLLVSAASQELIAVAWQQISKSARNCKAICHGPVTT